MPAPTARELLEGRNVERPDLRVIPLGILAARVEKVLALHTPVWPDLPNTFCKACGQVMPCPTVRALNGEEE